MAGTLLPGFRNWFDEYCASFSSADANDQRNITLKHYHTHQVRENILAIARGESLAPEQQDIAEIVALFHDLGRFEQYRRFKTFKDSDSVNHAALSADILAEKNILQGLTKADQDLILKAVRLHNVFVTPANLDADTNLFLKLIRDADKLDIWRVFLEFYALPDSERASAVSLGFPDLPEISPDVLAMLHDRCMVSLSMLKTLNDFKLLQLSWVFDLNFTTSFGIVRDRSYIDRLAATLPKDGEIEKTVTILKEFVREKLES